MGQLETTTCRFWKHYNNVYNVIYLSRLRTDCSMQRTQTYGKLHVLSAAFCIYIPDETQWPVWLVEGKKDDFCNLVFLSRCYCVTCTFRNIILYWTGWLSENKPEIFIWKTNVEVNKTEIFVSDNILRNMPSWKLETNYWMYVYRKLI